MWQRLGQLAGLQTARPGYRWKRLVPGWDSPGLVWRGGRVLKEDDVSGVATMGSRRSLLILRQDARQVECAALPPPLTLGLYDMPLCTLPRGTLACATPIKLRCSLCLLGPKPSRCRHPLCGIPITSYYDPRAQMAQQCLVSIISREV